jgi:hypothetical protein
VADLDAMAAGGERRPVDVAHPSLFSTHQRHPKRQRHPSAAILGVMDDVFTARLVGIPMTASGDVDVYSGVARLSGFAL